MGGGMGLSIGAKWGLSIQAELPTLENQGTKRPNLQVCGPKYCTYNGIWDAIPSNLDPWTSQRMSLKGMRQAVQHQSRMIARSETTTSGRMQGVNAGVRGGIVGWPLFLYSLNPHGAQKKSVTHCIGCPTMSVLGYVLHQLWQAYQQDLNLRMHGLHLHGRLAKELQLNPALQPARDRQAGFGFWTKWCRTEPRGGDFLEVQDYAYKHT